MSLDTLSTSLIYIAVGWLHATAGANIQASWCLLTIRVPLDLILHIFQRGSGLEIGLAMTGSWSSPPPCTPWWTWLCGMDHCPTGEKTILRVGEHCQSRRKQVFSQDNLVCGLLHVSFTKTNLAQLQPCWKSPDHHRPSTKFHSGWSFTRHCCLQASPGLCLTISLFRSLSHHQVLCKAENIYLNVFTYMKHQTEA